jgi:ceramide glucosyltransferase
MSGTAWAGMPILQWLLLLPVLGGSLYSFACLAAMARLRAAARANAAARPVPTAAAWPQVSMLKPVYGLGRDLRENLRTACTQDYPDYQLVLSAQREDEPALPLLYELQRELGLDRVSVVVDGSGTVPNGKVRNLLVGLAGARHDLLVVSDADVRLRPDYLKTIVAPLAAPARLPDPAEPSGPAAARHSAQPPAPAEPSLPDVGCVTTFYRAYGARRWYEALEQLFFNADWVPNLVFAHVTGASPFVLGASNAVRRSTLDEIGGLAELGYYLLEDFEMGRRIRARGQRIAVVPYFVDMLVDLPGPGAWWRHQLYWDKNTRAGNPWGLFGTLFIRAIPFALAFAAVRGGDRLGLAVLAAAAAFRMLAGGLFMGWGLGDRGGLRWLWLLPLRDLAGFVSTAMAFARPTVTWSGARFVVGRGGRMVAEERGRPMVAQEPAP